MLFLIFLVFGAKLDHVYYYLKKKTFSQVIKNNPKEVKSLKHFLKHSFLKPTFITLCNQSFTIVTISISSPYLRCHCNLNTFNILIVVVIIMYIVQVKYFVCTANMIGLPIEYI